MRLTDAESLKVHKGEDGDHFLWLKYQARKGIAHAQVGVRVLDFQQRAPFSFKPIIVYHERSRPPGLLMVLFVTAPALHCLME